MQKVLYNNFNMDPLAKIPLTLQTVSDLQKRTSSQQEISQYRQNMKQFVQKVETEVAYLIEKHNDQVKKLNAKIYNLENENKRLRKNQYQEQTKSPNHNEFEDIENIECFSPIPKRRGSPDLYSAKSTAFKQTMASKFSMISPRKSMNLPINSLKSYNKVSESFPIQILDPETDRI